MTLIDERRPTRPLLERVLAQIDAMDKQFALLAANNRALRERVVARLAARSKPGKVIDLASRKKLGEGR